MTLRDLFLIGDDGLPILNPAGRNIVFLKRIIERDRGTPGDTQGRKKRRATQELAFIYFVVQDQLFRAYRPEQRRRLIAEKVGLGDLYVPDEEVENAIGELSADVKTPLENALSTIDHTLRQFNELLNFILDDCKASIAVLRAQDSIAELTDEEITKRQLLLSGISDQIGKVLKQSGELPKVREEMAKLEREVARERENTGTSEIKVKSDTAVSTFEGRKDLYARNKT